MPYFTHILDDDTREPVQGISVVVTDSQGKNLIDPVVSDWDGSFSLPEEPFKESAGKKIKVYGPGYETKIMDASNISYNSIFIIPLVGQSAKNQLGMHLNEKVKSKVADYGLPFILGGLSVFCFVMAIVIKK